MTKELTQEEQAKRERLRKNLRLLALAAALYYFFSAGYSYYEDSQAEKTRIVTEISDTFASKDDFLHVFSASNKLQDLQTEDCKVNGLSGFAFNDLDPNTSFKAEYEYGNDGRLGAVNFEVTFKEGIDFQDLQSFKNFVATCENTSSNETIEGVIKALKLDVKNKAELIDGVGAKTKYVYYTLKIGAQDKLSIRAVRGR